MAKCLVCPSNDATIEKHNTRTHYVHCPQCIEYHVTFEAVHSLSELDDHVKPRVSRWIHDQCRYGTTPKISASKIEFLRDLKPLPFEERANRVLLFIADHTEIFGARIRLFNYPELFTVAESFKGADLQFILNYLQDRNYVQFSKDGSGEGYLTGDGFKEVDRLKETKGNSIHGFVAMWFNQEMDAIWEDALKPAIEEAGYEPVRLDKTEHNNKICDEIIAKIRRSRFVVADFTGHRGNVYYEAGFAAGLGVPLIFTCKAEESKKLEFDVRQFNTIEWTDPDDLRNRLTARISATIGDGPRRAVAAASPSKAT